MELLLGLIAVISITYFVVIVAHYLVVWFIVWMKWDETDWFESLNKRNKK